VDARTIVTPSLRRHHDPVVIPGTWLTALVGLPNDEIVAYAHGAAIRGTVATPLTRPIQIPMQIDERAANGAYVSQEDGRFDRNDEVIVMAADVGGWVLTPTVEIDGVSRAPQAVVTVTDPLGGQGWIYLLHIAKSIHQIRAPQVDYVAYDDTRDAITGRGHYTLGFSPDTFSRDYLAIASDATDILDREKFHLVGSAQIDPSPFPLPFDITGDNLTKQAVKAIDGPVRVTRVATYSLMFLGQEVAQLPITLFGYRAMVGLPVPAPAGDDGGLKLDRVHYANNLNAQAEGMTYYDANTPTGVGIDGVPDEVPPTPMAIWNQIVGTRGTLIHIYQGAAQLGGSQMTHYVDDAAQGLYGETGFTVQAPSPSEPFTLLMATYVLTEPHTADLGAKYAEHLANPLQIRVWNATAATSAVIYLPLVVK